MSTSEPNLLYSDVEQELRASVRQLLADRCPWRSVLDRVSGPGDPAEAADLALWRELAALGGAGLSVAEDLGGAGATARESSVVAEELGRAVAPVPFLGSAVLATSALTALDGREPVRALLADLAAGGRTAALAVPLSTAPGADFPTLVRAEGGTLHGTVPGVADALTADVLVVPAVAADGPGLYLVEADRAVRTPVVSLDQTRPLAEVRLDGAAAVAVASGRRAADALESALVAGAALLAAEQLGAAEWALDTTVAHLKERVQFGRPLGSFQALKHRLADLWVSLSQARAVVRNAAGALADGSPDAPLAAALAQAFVSEVAVRAAEEAVQLHGGTGFTWEYPVHLYLKRAKSSAIALGTADRHRARIAELVDLPPAP